MSIYVSHATCFDFRAELYPAFGDGFILPHADGHAQYPIRRAIADGEIMAVIAEVSYPSTGQGIELGWASAAGLPIACIVKDGFCYSTSLREISAQFHFYRDLDELRALVTCLRRNWQEYLGAVPPAP